MSVRPSVVADNGTGPRVYVTVDVEPDCPPYLWTWRGIEDGMPALMHLFDQEGVPATCFTTGATAERYPKMIRDVVEKGHELACHGFSHTSFQTFTWERARDEIFRTNSILRAVAPVVSFRAPYLQLPESFVPLLAEEGIRIDASRARYKLHDPVNGDAPSVVRLPASVTSSVLRLPRVVRDLWLKSLADPIVIFVHPWEFVDLTRTKLRYDCRFRTGAPALTALRTAIALFRASNARFERVRDYRPDP